LRRLGFRDDLEAATEVDRHDIVPVYSERLVTAPNST
jgi:phosphosulfolactate phosphohydrolase-like enzyme